MSPEEFDYEFGPEFAPRQAAPTIDHNPYGGPAQARKTGLTTRGKAALAIGATVIAGGSLIGYQAYSASAAEAEQKAQELALKSQALELEKLRELNRADQTRQKTQATEDKARQASFGTCLKSKEHLVGKGFGSPSYRDIVDACQTQNTGTTTGTDMKAAASVEDTDGSSGGGVNSGLLVGVGVLCTFVVVVAKVGKRSNPA